MQQPEGRPSSSPASASGILVWLLGFFTASADFFAFFPQGRHHLCWLFLLLLPLPDGAILILILPKPLQDQLLKPRQSQKNRFPVECKALQSESLSLSLSLKTNQYQDHILSSLSSYVLPSYMGTHARKGGQDMEKQPLRTCSFYVLKLALQNPVGSGAHAWRTIKNNMAEQCTMRAVRSGVPCSGAAQGTVGAHLKETEASCSCLLGWPVAAKTPAKTLDYWGG